MILFYYLVQTLGFLQSVAKIRNKRKVECFHPEDNSQLFFIANTQDNKNTQICCNNRTTHNVLFHYFSDFNLLWISKEAGKK